MTEKYEFTIEYYVHNCSEDGHAWKEFELLTISGDKIHAGLVEWLINDETRHEPFEGMAGEVCYLSECVAHFEYDGEYGGDSYWEIDSMTTVQHPEWVTGNHE